MSKIISKLGMGRICLMFFILFCSVLTSKNAFSARYWQRDDMKVTYDHTDHSITCKFLIYDYCDTISSYMREFELHYTEGTQYISLIKGKIDPNDVVNDVVCIYIRPNRYEKIVYPESLKIKNEKLGSDPVGFKMKDTQRKESGQLIKSKTAYMSIKLSVPNSCKDVKFIKIKGKWTNDKSGLSYSFENPYQPEKVKSNSHTALKSEISNNVKVTGETDAINVTGTEPGENINIYTISGSEVKSVVANDDVVNIKLPKNQIYIVKAGQARYKVAM